jgi:hypothetical protein
MSAEDENVEDAAYLDGLANGGVARTYVTDDGMVIVFPGDGTSFHDSVATEKNRRAVAERAQHDNHVTGRIKALEKRLDAIEANHKAGT